MRWDGACLDPVPGRTLHQRMRVLVLNWFDWTHPLWGGAEVYLRETCLRLVKRGHEVTLIASAYDGSVSDELLDGVRVLRRGRFWTFHLELPWHVSRITRDDAVASSHRDWDVVLEYTNKVPLLSPVWAPAPVVAIAHHLWGTSIFSESPWPVATAVWASELLLPVAYRRVPWVAVSESTLTDLVAHGIPRSRVVIAKNGIESRSDFAVPIELGAEADDSGQEPLRVVWVGRMRRYKRVDVLLRAFGLLRDAVPRVCLDVVGDGPEAASLQDLARSLQLGPQAVTFHGAVSEATKWKLLRKAAVLVQPSMKEGWGRTVLEAGIIGVPSVASDVPGLRDAIDNDRTGLLVPAGDVESLAEALTRLLSDPQLRQRLGREARVFAELHTWDHATDVLEGVLGEASRTALSPLRDVTWGLPTELVPCEADGQSSSSDLVVAKSILDEGNLRIGGGPAPVSPLPPAAIVPEPSNGFNSRGWGVPLALRPGMARLASLPDFAIRHEAWYAVPAAMAMVWAIDQSLSDALHLDQLLGPLLWAARTDRWPSLAILLLLSAVPWLSRMIRTGTPLVPTGLEAPVLLWLIGAQIGFYRAGYGPGAQARMLGIVGAVLLFYLAWHTGHTRNRRDRWLASLVYASLVCAGLTLSWLQFVLASGPLVTVLGPVLSIGASYALPQPFHMAFFTVAQRILVHPNALADLLIVALVGSFGLSVGLRNDAFARMIWIAVLVLSSVALLATAARTGVVAALFGLVPPAWVVISRRWRPMLLMVPMLVFGGLAFVLPADKASVLLDGNGDSLGTQVVSRLRVWSGYWELIRLFPATGVGLGLWAVAGSYSNMFGLDLYFADPHAHNWLIQGYLEQTGIGLTGFSLLMGAPVAAWILRRRAQARSEVNRDDVPVASCVGIIVALLIHNLFEGNLSTNVVTALIASAAGCALRGHEDNRQSGFGGIQTSRTLWVATVVVSIVGIATGIVPAPYTPGLYIR